MKYCVVGGSGFIGAQLVKLLQARGLDVTNIDKTFPSDPAIAKITTICDITADLDILAKVVPQMSRVYFAAATADLGQANAKPREVMLVDVIGLINTLSAISTPEETGFCYLSSMYAAGLTGGYYRCAKISGEHLVREFSKQNNLTYRIVRLGSVYGINPSSVCLLNEIVRSAVVNSHISISSPRPRSRQYLHLEDATRVLASVFEMPANADTLELVGPEGPLELSQLVDLVAEIVGINRHEIVITTESESLHYGLSAHKVSPLPRRIQIAEDFIPLEQGIVELAEHYRIR